MNIGDRVKLGYPWFEGATGVVASIEENRVGIIFDCRTDGAVIRMPLSDVIEVV